MKYITTLARLGAIASLSLTMLVANSGIAFAQIGTVGRHYDAGAKCMFNELHVNEPKVFAVDATTAVDTQVVYWTSEIWRLDETTGQFVFVASDNTWISSVVDDGTQSNSMTLGGGQTYNIYLSGTYRVAIQYLWQETPNALPGHAYEWVSRYHQADWQWILGTDLAPADACTFTI